MKIKVFQKGFNYSQDGEGNRLVYHLQGCNMKCPWCANPEGMAADGVLMISKVYLIDEICPFGAIKQKYINQAICKACKSRECINLYRTKGIKLSYEEYDIASIVEEAKRSTPLFYDGGGVTLSGGEATLQFDGVKKLLRALKAEGIHTAIETNGTHLHLQELFPFIDLLIMDFKHYNDLIHKNVTGIPHKIIKQNIGKALTHHPKVLIRLPLIKGFNALENDARNFAAFFKQYKTTEATFEFLAYHEYGKAKWAKCGMTYSMEDAYIDQETISLFEKIFKENNLLIIRT